MRSSRLRAPLRALALSLVCALAPVAHAGDVETGRQLYKRGEAAFAMGDYQQATELFQRAYEETGRPQLLWNLGAAWRKRFEIDHDISHLRRARSIYENYESVIGDRHEVAEAQREVRALDEQIAAAEAASRSAASSAVRSATPSAVRSATPPAAVIPPTLAPLPTTGAAEPAIVVEPEPAHRPLHKKWWLWTAVGGAILVGAGVGVGVALGTGSTDAAAPLVTAGNYRPSFP